MRIEITDSQNINLWDYIRCRDDLPYFTWSSHEHEMYGVEGRVIGPIWYKSNVDFGANILWSKQHMRTNQADAALIIDSYYDFLEGARRHDWIWFREGKAFHPDDVKIRQPTYESLDHALESIGREIQVPADLFRYIIVNSNLTPEQKRSVGMDQPEFTEYKF